MTMLNSQPAFDEERFEEIYLEHFELLVGVAVQKFGIPESEAETLAHEVFLSYLKRGETVRELRPWLIGAVCHASRYYWRTHRRVPPADAEAMEVDRPDPSSTRILDSLPDQLAAREALECLSPQCQQILRLRYFDGCSIIEVAEHLGIKPKYAQKLITKCLRRAEKQYGAKGAPS
jgi:RNA polymerase sigma factor (sigma-70 family)